jgi:hypothetical protein
LQCNNLDWNVVNLVSTLSGSKNPRIYWSEIMRRCFRIVRFAYDFEPEQLLIENCKQCDCGGRGTPMHEFDLSFVGKIRVKTPCNESWIADKSWAIGRGVVRVTRNKCGDNEQWIGWHEISLAIGPRNAPTFQGIMRGIVGLSSGPGSCCSESRIDGTYWGDGIGEEYNTQSIRATYEGTFKVPFPDPCMDASYSAFDFSLVGVHAIEC